MPTLDFQDEELSEAQSLAAELDAMAPALADRLGAAEVRELLDFCGIYRSTIRPVLDRVRRILCGRAVRFVVGGTPCEVLGQVINFLDGICPDNS